MTSPTASPPLSRTFYLALFALLLFAMSFTVLLPIIPLFITHELGAAERWIGTGSLVISLAAVGTRLPGGVFSDRHGRRRTMLIGAALGTAGAALLVVTRSLEIFLLSRLVMGASLGLYTTANKALVADLAPPERRGEALGLSNAAFSLASVFSPLIGEGLKNATSFQAVFVLGLALAVLVLIVTVFLPKTRPTHTGRPPTRREMRLALGERGLWAALLLIMGIAVIMALIYTYFALMADRKDLFADAPRILSSISIGLGLSIWAVVDTVIEPVAGRISDRVGRQIVALPGLLVMLAGVVAFSQATNTASTYLAIAVMSAGWGIAHAVTDAVAQEAISPALRGMSAALLYTGFDVAIGGGGQVLGLLIDGNDFGPFFAGTLLLATVLGGLGVILLTRLQTYEQRFFTHPAQSV